MRKSVLAVALVLILLALPLAARRVYFYEGGYEARDVPRPNLDSVQAPTPEMASFVDRYTAASPGIVLVDTAHENRFDMSELNVLQARLAARGQWLEPVETAKSLTERLRYAKALLVISPAKEFTADEKQQIEGFVHKGGRLLLVTDPTRFGVRFDDYGDVLGLDNDVIYVNDLAAQFGLVFQPDYLYNMVENEGNFRNIELTDLAEHPLTQGVEQVVFYATHSIVSEELTLVKAGGETRTSDSERAGELVVAVLAADGAVLALGDLTFMTEPYNAVYDNDRLIANIADFLSASRRRYELADFPFFFGDEVDLVYADDPLLDSDILKQGGALQAFLDEKGKILTVREMENPARDTLFLGLYAYSDEVEPYLVAAGVTFVVTPTRTPEDEWATPTLTQTFAMTAPLSTPVPPTGTLDITSTVALSVTPALSPTVPNRVEIASLGQMVVTGTALSVLQRDGERHVLVVLAHTETGLENVVQRLTETDLEGCLLREMFVSLPTTLALCPSGEVAPGEAGGGWEQAEPAPTPAATPVATATPAPTAPITETVEPTPPPGEPEGRIVVVALDDGEGRYDGLTSAPDYAEILKQRFEVTVWSKARDGSPEATDLLDYDLIIWTAGDFESPIGEAESELLFSLVFEGKPVLVSGAYLDDTAPTAVQRDIQVEDAGHPLARGFDPGEVIRFVPSPSNREYEISLLGTDLVEEITTVFVRGPESEEAGAGSIFVAEEATVQLRMTFIGFPLYLLPQDAKTRLVLNAVDWMLASGE